ncbi:hypothetical protein B0O99DRAFT_650484 [Bisporella sp. PMI_857]|jgi:DNA-directed RNA polymerase specialized sigma subunit|nr:hypothetical protein B0O99DRAFT_650484 [Bisporella sp. PMI_857]
MGSFDEKHDGSHNGLTITRPTASRQPSHLSQSVRIPSTIHDVDSTHTLTPSQSLHDEKLTTASVFDKELGRSESKENINNATSFETDVEACLTPQKTKASAMTGLLNNKSDPKDCSVWPGQAALKRKKKMMRKERGKHMLCGWMAGMPKRNQIIIKIFFALLVIGAAVGIGVGISKAVGGGVWKNKSNSNAALT